MYLLQRSFKVGEDRYTMRLADVIVEKGALSHHWQDSRGHVWTIQRGNWMNTA
jgi:hypothetical protein